MRTLDASSCIGATHFAVTSQETTTTETAAHYRKPSWFTQHAFNPTVSGLTRLGISVWGSRVLGTSATSTDEQLLAIAPKHPVFMLDDAA